MSLFVRIVTVFLTGAAWAKTPSYRKSLLQDLFGNLLHNRSPLKDVYFTLRPDSTPLSSWYRFNLTYGQLDDIGNKLKPKDDRKVCVAECKRKILNARCHFDIENASLTYYGQMSFGKPVVANFQLYAWITKFQFYSHTNPALLSSSIVQTTGKQAGQRMGL